MFFAKVEKVDGSKVCRDAYPLAYVPLPAKIV